MVQPWFFNTSGQRQYGAWHQKSWCAVCDIQKYEKDTLSLNKLAREYDLCEKEMVKTTNKQNKNKKQDEDKKKKEKTELIDIEVTQFVGAHGTFLVNSFSSFGLTRLT